MLKIPQLLRNSRALLCFTLLAYMVVACAGRIKQRDFIPEKDSLFTITFLYPDIWEWEELPVSNYKNFEGISIVSPYSENENPATASVVSVFVTITNRSLDETTLLMNRVIRELLIVSQERPQLQIVEDHTFEIDGHYARKITRRSWTSEMDKLMIEEFIYIVDKERYYFIYMTIPEDEQNDRFHTEFKAMIESIKFLP